MLSFALKNIAKNKKNSAILILFISIITFLFFAGNTVIGKAERIIRRSFVESLTGDVVLEKAGDITMNLFGANIPVIDSYFTIPVFPAYDLVMELAGAEAGVEGITSQVSGAAYMELLSVKEPVLLCGIDAGTYFPLFPGVTLEEGCFLRANEYGAMITMERAIKIERQTGLRPAPGAPLLFTSGGTMGFKIREVPLVGIFSYETPGQFMNEIVIADPQTVRVLNSIRVAGSANAGPGGDIPELLSADTNDLFGGAFSSTGVAGTTEEEGFTAEFLRAFLNETGGGEGAEETGGDWNFIIIRLKKGWPASAFISSINKKLSSFGVTAVNWRVAAGTSAILLLLVQALFNAGVFLVAIAGIIAAINILLISVFKRTREIGTLRAIGASDLFIRSVIFSENLAVALIGGLVGILGGLLAMQWLNSLGLKVSNNLIASLLGGATLRLEFIPHIAILSFAMAMALGFAASLYPIEAALRVEPMAAVRRG